MTRNHDALLYFMEQADCPYRAIGKAHQYCGPYFDDFEINRGWTVNPDGTDTATDGTWQRGVVKADTFQLDKDRDRQRTHLSDALGYLIWQECRPLPTVGERRGRLF